MQELTVLRILDIEGLEPAEHQELLEAASV